ncbi:MAG: hypothetical protein AB1792_09755 [Candidatus Zixiibacteriota bacterium]
MVDEARRFGRCTLVIAALRLRPVMAIVFALSAAYAVGRDRSDCRAAATDSGELRVSDADTAFDTTGQKPLPIDSTHPVGGRVDSIPERLYVPVHRAWSTSRRAYDRTLDGPTWPMPPVKVAAAADLADWMLLDPRCDVDDAPGAGQTRLLTHWGLVPPSGRWCVDNRPMVWQRLTFPQRPGFDVGTLPSFAFSDYRVAERVRLERDTLWGVRPQSSYFARQGDFAETYSQAEFRQTIRNRMGFDFTFAFFGGDGRFASDQRDLRHIDLRLGGHLHQNYFWNWRYTQFRDKTTVLTPAPFDVVHPLRDDLLWQMEATVYRPAVSSAGWIAGASVQSGKQKLTDGTQGYRLKSRDRLWTLWGNGSRRGWFLDGSASWEELLIAGVEPSRWNLALAAGRQWSLRDLARFTAQATVSDADHDAPAVGGTLVLAPDSARMPLLPVVRLARERAIPSLLDRYRPPVEYAFLTAGQSGVLYAEQGDPGLPAQWTNVALLHWGTEHACAGDQVRFTAELRCAYVEHYFRWDGQETVDTVLGEPITRQSYRPTSTDARTVGMAIGIDGPRLGRFVGAISYAAKYAETLEHARLTGYYPHKGVAMLSWVAPQLGYGADVRIDATGIWWYGDRRIDPTGYSSPHAFRFDLAGTATIKDFTLIAQMQNVAGFPYRTQAGYPFTGRTLRFGIDWRFLD